MAIKTNKLRGVLLYFKAGLRKLITSMKKRLDPDWLNRLELAVEGEIQWVSYRDIELVSQEKFSTNGISKVFDGERNELSLPFEQLDLYQAVVAVYRNGRPWSETPFFQRALGEIKSGRTGWGCRTEHELKTRLQGLEDLYREISGLGRLNHSDRDPISVSIGRCGDLLLNGGEHRLACARLLELPHIPAIIVARHRQWVEFKHEIEEYALQHRGVYAPLLHPDLRWIPARRGHERFDLIRRALISQHGAMLDIGCHWGYFCHRFEEIGFDCTGVEVSPTNFYFLQKLKRAGNRNFRVFNRSIFDYIDQERRQYDVVLALNIFHHFLKSESTLHQLKNLLANLHSREIYFEPHRPSESQMWNAYWNPTPDEFVAFMLEHSGLNRAVYLGQQGGRRLYQLTV